MKFLRYFDNNAWVILRVHKLHIIREDGVIHKWSHIRKDGGTLNFFKIVCKGDFFRKGGSNSWSAWYQLSFEPSTTSVRVDLFLCSKISTNCTNSCSKKLINTYRGGWWLKWTLTACWWRIGPSFAEEITFADYFEKVQWGPQSVKVSCRFQGDHPKDSNCMCKLQH